MSCGTATNSLSVNVKPLDEVAAGKVKFEGERKSFDKLRGMLTTFEMGFEVLPGTVSAPAPTSKKKPFEQDAPEDSSGG